MRLTGLRYLILWASDLGIGPRLQRGLQRLSLLMSPPCLQASMVSGYGGWSGYSGGGFDRGGSRRCTASVISSRGDAALCGILPPPSTLLRLKNKRFRKPSGRDECRFQMRATNLGRTGSQRPPRAFL